jgi:RimJ/RimL family protein N-acetyltransferase
MRLGGDVNSGGSPMLPAMSEKRIERLPIVGSGFVIRRLQASDLRAFQTYRGDPELGRYQGWSVMADDEAREFLIRMNGVPMLTPAQWTQLGIAAADDSRLIGDIGIFVDEDGREAEIGFTLERASQGRGIATLAVRGAISFLFETTPVHLVRAVTDARNLASMRLLERVGMTKLSTSEVMFRGEPCVEHTYRLRR